MSRPFSRLPVLAALATLALSAGCASTPAPANTQLQGHWRLDSAASDDAAARIASAVSTAEERLRAHRAGGGGRVAGGPGSGRRGGDGDEGPDDGSQGGGGAGDDAGGDLIDLGATVLIGPDFPQLRQRLQQMLASPHSLTITVHSDEVQIERDDLPGRDYQPGETITRFEEYGTAQLKDAWKDQAFILRERYTSGARLEERYALDAHGALVYTRSLRDPTVGRIEIRSVYRRTGTPG